MTTKSPSDLRPIQHVLRYIESQKSFTERSLLSTQVVDINFAWTSNIAQKHLPVLLTHS